MSRRRNNVRGPMSALTEFLRESGINPDTIARRVATQNQAENLSPSVAGPSNSGDNVEGALEQEQQEEDVPQASNGRRTRGRASRAIDYASDELDDPEEESPAKKRKSTKGRATAVAKAKAKKKAKEDGDYEGSSEDEYTAVSKNLWSMGGNGGPKPPVGSFENCAKCEKQFTVTKYTMAANPPPGYLCHPCSKASGNDPFKKPAVPRKRKPVADKRDIVSYEERRFPTLAAMCIELITRYIDDVEALGDIGSMNMDEIAKALSKNRGLTPENAHLFYDVLNKKLRFYDATNLTPDALATLASLNPNLTHLHLDYCGRLTSPVLSGFATSMPQLTSITLLGPFLVRAEAWIEFFKAMPCLRVFKITQSPRINLKCVQALAESCTKLEELSLREIGLMDDTFADPLCSLSPLRVLDLAFPGIGIDEDGWIRLMETHGGTLETLDASKHEGFTDHVLLDGVRKYARVLLELKLQECLDLTDEGVAQFFTDWASPISTLKHDDDDDDDDMDVDSAPDDVSAVSLGEFTPNPPLHVLSLARNQELSSAALTAAIIHSAQSLTWLNVNGLRGASSEALAELKRATELRYLDVGWCRELDDFVMKDVVTACTKLSEIKVWGCSRVRGVGWGVKSTGMLTSLNKLTQWHKTFTIMMSLSIQGVALAIGLLAFFAIVRWMSPHKRHMPPGPTPIPFLGNVFDINADALWVSYTKMRETYGNIVYTSALGMDIVVLNSEEVANELLEGRSQIYSDRPYISTRDLFGWEWATPFLRYGERFKTHRRLFHQVFRPEAILSYRPKQLQKAFEMLPRLLHDPTGYAGHFESSVLICLLPKPQVLLLDRFSASVIMSVVYDYDIASHDDVIVSAAKGAMDLFLRVATPQKTALFAAFPFLMKLPCWVPGLGLKDAILSKKYVKDMLDMPYDYVIRNRAS
ncbi:hypothetical protein AZE42_07502 [Rhizopogon vesiculosus]|uniref:DNA repair protein rhp7 treble clef domain-containing protein n=1 Tax=Rhizopogon vesiculosus TaxID=180088 RepID=A0A1J8PJ23_9AGAM|nr:hypothetical protein AZE42_07502 [Rhizopogon vesiculosus]